MSFPIPSLTAALLLGGCVASPVPMREHASVPSFDPIVFFAGHTRGVGSLKVLMKRRKTVTVEGHGALDRDGTIVLDQDVREGDRPATHRTWRLQRTAPGRYAGSLTGSTGPVTADVTDGVLHLDFMMKGGLHAQQWLRLEPGGQASHNRMVVAKFGVPVAVLDETIMRVPE